MNIRLIHNRSYHFLLFILPCFVLSLSSCGSPKVENEVKDSEDLCPIELGKIGKVTNVTQNDSAVVMTVMVEEDSVKFDSSFVSKHNTESLMRTILTVKDKNPKNLFRAMRDHNNGLQFVMTGSKSGKILKSSISGHRLTQLVDEKGRPIADPDRKIRYAATDSIQHKLVELNKTLPKDLRQGLKLKSVSIEGGYLLYQFNLNGMGLSLDKVRNNPQAVKDELFKLLPGIETITPQLKPSCLGVIMRFYEPIRSKNPKKKVRYNSEGILITPAELNQLL